MIAFWRRKLALLLSSQFSVLKNVTALPWKRVPRVVLGYLDPVRILYRNKQLPIRRNGFHTKKIRMRHQVQYITGHCLLLSRQCPVIYCTWYCTWFLKESWNTVNCFNLPVLSLQKVNRLANVYVGVCSSWTGVYLHNRSIYHGISNIHSIHCSRHAWLPAANYSSK